MLSDILPHLEEVKKVGKRYTARCPVHKDKTPSLSLTEKDGVVLIHCFGCQANGIEVTKKLRLSPGLLFRDQKKGNRVSMEALELAKEDVFFIDLYEQKKARQERITINELRRYRLAQQRVKLLNIA